MKGFELLDFIIGLSFIYLILSLVISALRESWAGFKNLRAKELENWLESTFRKGDLGKKIRNHKLVDGLTSAGRKVSYIPSDIFVDTFLDQLLTNQKKTYTLSELENLIDDTDLLDDDFKRVLLQYIKESKRNLESFKEKVANWYDNAMIRISGTYTRRSKRYILYASIMIAIVFNIDTITLSNYLYQNREVRKQLADDVTAMVQDTASWNQLRNQIQEHERFLNESDSLSANQKAVSHFGSDTLTNNIALIQENMQEADSLVKVINSYNFPIGWDKAQRDRMFGSFSENTLWVNIFAVTMIFFGWILTGLAVSAGAPFWFEVINKTVNVRSVGREPKKVGPSPQKTEK